MWFSKRSRRLREIASIRRLSHERRNAVKAVVRRDAANKAFLSDCRSRLIEMPCPFVDGFCRSSCVHYYGGRVIRGSVHIVPCFLEDGSRYVASLGDVDSPGCRLWRIK